MNKTRAAKLLQDAWSAELQSLALQRLADTLNTQAHRLDDTFHKKWGAALSELGVPEDREESFSRDTMYGWFYDIVFTRRSIPNIHCVHRYITKVKEALTKTRERQQPRLL